MHVFQAFRRTRSRWLGHLMSVLLFASVIVAVLLFPRLSRFERESPTDRLAVALVGWHHVEQLSQPIAQFKTVFWEPRDTESVRELIRNSSLVRGKTILEIGTGTGLIALCCLEAGAAHVVATDVNPAAIANARYNAELLGFTDRLETRLVSADQPQAYSVVQPGERFDLIISNPPWEDARPSRIDDYALYDEDFQLLRSLLDGLDQHLEEDGRGWLVYGCVTAIRCVHAEAKRHRFTVIQRDDRRLDELPEVFLPGMLLELRDE